MEEGGGWSGGGREFHWLLEAGQPGKLCLIQFCDPRVGEGLSEEVSAFQPRAPFVLDQDTLLKCLRTAKRGAAGGPSRMTIEHIRSLLETIRLSCSVRQELSRGNMPDEVIRMLRMERVTALQKRRRGVRGIVAGDMVRRLVSRGQWPNSWGRHSNRPLPLSNTHCPHVQGASACLMSCQSMASARMIQCRGGQCWTASEVSVRELPCHSSDNFMGSFPRHLQGRGRRAGRCIDAHSVLVGSAQSLNAVAEELHPSERLLDSWMTSMLCAFQTSGHHLCFLPEETVAAREDSGEFGEELWNRGGVFPLGCEPLTRAAQVADPDAIVWERMYRPSVHQQGIRVFGTPLGQPEFVARQQCEFESRRGRTSPTVFDHVVMMIGRMCPCSSTQGGSTRNCPGLTDSQRAFLRSQGGHMASSPFTTCPASFHARFDPQLFRVLLLRRFWQPLPPVLRICRCGRPLDSSGHHSGVFGPGGFAVESAVARVCREAGGRVSCTVFVRDLDVGVPVAGDGRLPLFHGAQLAVDVTMVSALWCDGTPHRRAAEEDGGRREERTYPGLTGRFGRARLVVLACGVGGRWPEEMSNLHLQLAKAKVRGVPQPLKTSAKQSWLWRWRSFAQSLLEQRGVTGVDGPLHSLSEGPGSPNHNTNTAENGHNGGGGGGGGREGAEGWGPEGWAPKGLPPLPGFRVWAWRGWGPGQNVGLWVFGVSAFWIENLAKTLKHLKLAKVGHDPNVHVGALCLSCETQTDLGFSPRTPNVHISGSRSSKTRPKFKGETLSRERERKRTK